MELPANETNRSTGRDDVSTPEQAMLQENAREVHKAEIDISLLEGQVKQLEALEGDDLIRQTAELRIENRTILTDMPAYQQRISEREMKLNSGLGPKHPTILGLDSAIAKTRDALLAAAQDYRKSLSFRIQTAKDTYADAQRRYESQRTKILDVQSGSQEYLAAKREWELLQADVTRLKDTRAQKQIELGTAKTPMTVYQPAEAEGRPLKPNIKLNLALGGIVGLLFGFGLAFFLEYLDTSVKSMDEVEKTARHPRARRGAQGRGRAGPRRRHDAGLGGLPHPANEPRVQPQGPQRELHLRGQRQPRRGQEHHHGEPRHHLRAGRLHHADH